MLLMEKDVRYINVRFSAETLREALAVFTRLIPAGATSLGGNRKVELDDETWTFDSDEEFFAKYRKPFKGATVARYVYRGKVLIAKFYFSDSYVGRNQSAMVQVQLGDAPKIEEVFDVFERNVESSRLPVPAKPEPAPVRPTIFIGHGRSIQWRNLKDHLTDKQGYKVIAYETGERAGHTIRDILQELLIRGSFALLVLTAEDEMSTGQVRARQNVIHELGLFQGKLGFPRAIAVVEEGVEMLSNLDGVQQIRFGKDNIAETYGDVIAVLRREFGDAR
jgi:predicted nucleotide-binding protein